MAAIITQAEVVSLALNNANINTALIKDSILEASELQHIKPLLRDVFYYDILQNAANYTELLSGGTYVDRQGYTRTFRGLKKACAMYAKYELIPELYFQMTNLGLQVARSEFSSTGSDSQRAAYRLTVKSQADTLMNEVIEYLSEKRATYTLYRISDKRRVFGGIIMKKQTTGDTQIFDTNQP
jgi:hypothetical protein